MKAHRKSRFIAILVVVACVYGAWKFVGSFVSDDADTANSTDYLLNRVWIDHIPTDSRDMVAHLALIEDRHGEIGITGVSSNWRHFVELFFWQLDGRTLEVFFPQERARGRVQVATWNCDGEVDPHFELCLRITNRQGDTSILYSREDWVIDPHSVDRDIDRLIAAEPTLAGIADTLRGAHAHDDDAEFDIDAAEDWAEHTLQVAPLGL